MTASAKQLSSCFTHESRFIALRVNLQGDVLGLKLVAIDVCPVHETS